MMVLFIIISIIILSTYTPSRLLALFMGHLMSFNAHSNFMRFQMARVEIAGGNVVVEIPVSAIIHLISVCLLHSPGQLPKLGC